MNRSVVLAMNLALVLAVGACLWQFLKNQRTAELRERAFSTATLPAVQAAVLRVESTSPAAPVQYADIALRSLFTPDRHPHVAADPPPAPAPEPVVPAFPVAHGVLDLGAGPVVLLSVGGERQRAYRPGDTLGPWKLQSIAGERFVFEWIEEGRIFEKTLGELRPRYAAAATPQTEPVGGAAHRRENHELTGDGPGPATGRNHRVCKSGDRTPVGTVVDGFRKVESPTPFGNVCRWELVAGDRG